MSSKKPYCVAPWTSLYLDPKGNVYPCCVWQQQGQVVGEVDGFGNINENTIEEVFNSEEAQRVKKAMLDNEHLPECGHCHKHEKREDGWGSYRKHINERFSHLIEDYEKDPFKLGLWDVRISNFCNFKCRSCGHSLSSSWYEDTLKLNPEYKYKALITIDNKEGFFEQLEPHFDYVEEIYFAGGEPLIMPEHYRILDKLIEKNRKIKLRYNTNLSVLDRKNIPIEDYWDFFESVEVGVSLDGIGNIGEYARKGLITENITKNIKRVLDFVKKDRDKGKSSIILFTTTISIFNYFHLFDFINYFLENKFLTNYSILQPNNLYNPEEYDTQILPMHAKALFKSQMDNFNFNGIDPYVAQNIQKFLSEAYEHSITENKPSKHLNNFAIKTKELDEMRKENFLQVFKDSPLLKYVKQYWNN